ELFGVTGPAVPQQQLHGLGRAGRAALLAEPRQEERHQLVQVLDVVAQRRELPRAPGEPQQRLGAADTVSLLSGCPVTAGTSRRMTARRVACGRPMRAQAVGSVWVVRWSSG